MAQFVNIFLNFKEKKHKKPSNFLFHVDFQNNVCMKPAGKLENWNPFSISKGKSKKISSSDSINPTTAGSIY